MSTRVAMVAVIMVVVMVVMAVLVILSISRFLTTRRYTCFGFELLYTACMEAS